MFRFIFFLLLSTNLFAQQQPIEITAGVQYNHSNTGTGQVYDYLFQTNNKCLEEAIFTVDCITYSVPDRFLVTTEPYGLGDTILYTHWTGAACSTYGPPGEICTSGYYEMTNGNVVISYIVPNNWYPGLTCCGTTTIFRLSISTAEEVFYVRAISSSIAFTQFGFYLHPTQYTNSPEPVINYFVEYTCDSTQVEYLIIPSGNPPCDTLNIYEIVYDSAVDNIFVNLDTTVLEGTILELCAPENLINVDWYSNQQYGDCITITPYENQTLIISAQTENGCIGTDHIFVSIYTLDTYIPNAFSPNGDGTNDLFTFYTPIPVQFSDILIYTRWGDVIANPDQFWDGKDSKGQDCQVGVYIYKIVLDFFDGNSRMFSGDITIIR